MFGLFKKKEPITYNINIAPAGAVYAGGNIHQRKVEVSSDFKARLAAREFVREVSEENQVKMVVHSINTVIGKEDNGWDKYRELKL